MELLNVLANNQFLLLLLIGVLIILLTLLISSIQAHNKDYNRKVIKQQLDIMKEVEDMDKENTEAPKADIAQVLNDMEQKLDKKSPISTFEEEQEEKAIISYQELIKSVKNLKNDYVDPDDIKEQEDPELLDLDFKSEPVKEEFLTEPEKPKFKNSEFISPVYGRMQPPTNMIKDDLPDRFDDEIEEVDLTANPEVLRQPQKVDLITKLNERNLSETEKSVEFLSALKEFRKNLE